MAGVGAIGRIGRIGAFGAGGGALGWVASLDWDVAFDFTRNLGYRKGSGFGAPSSMLTCVRSTPEYVQSSSGLWTSVSANTLALSNVGLSIGDNEQNLFLNSLAPVTQTITVVASTVYTVALWADGGTLTLSGAGSGTVNANGSVTFTASTTSLTVTVSSVTGSFTAVNVSALSYKTNPIATAGAAVTRNADVVTMAFSNSGDHTLFVDATPFGLEGAAATAARAALTIDVSPGSVADRSCISKRPGTVSAGTVGIVASASTGTFFEGGAISWSTRRRNAHAISAASSRFYENGAPVGALDTAVTIPSTDRLALGGGGGLAAFNGVIHRAAVIKRRLSDAEVLALDTA